MIFFPSYPDIIFKIGGPISKESYNASWYGRTVWDVRPRTLQQFVYHSQKHKSSSKKAIKKYLILTALARARRKNTWLSVIMHSPRSLRQEKSKSSTRVERHGPPHQSDVLTTSGRLRGELRQLLGSSVTRVLRTARVSGRVREKKGAM